MSYSHYFWIAPFISMLAGYSAVSLLYPIKKIPTPSLVGIRLEEAVKQLSEKNLNIRIIGTKEDGQLPNATIINQTPSPQTPIKEYQTMYCVISHKPEDPLMPSLIGKTNDQAIILLQDLHIRAKLQYRESTQTKGICIAQSVSHGQPVNAQETVVVYVSQGMLKPVKMPSFKQHEVSRVIEYLDHHGFKYTLMSHEAIEQNHQCHTCVIVDQWPRAGSFILQQSDKQPTIQLYIKHKTVADR